MTEHLCSPNDCTCDEDAALAEHLCFHNPKGHPIFGTYGPEARRGCVLCYVDLMRARLRVQSHDLLELTTAEGVRAFFGAKRRKVEQADD